MNDQDPHRPVTITLGREPPQRDPSERRMVAALRQAVRGRWPARAGPCLADDRPPLWRAGARGAPARGLAGGVARFVREDES